MVPDRLLTDHQTKPVIRGSTSLFVYLYVTMKSRVRTLLLHRHRILITPSQKASVHPVRMDKIRMYVCMLSQAPTRTWSGRNCVRRSSVAAASDYASAPPLRPVHPPHPPPLSSFLRLTPSAPSISPYPSLALIYSFCTVSMAANKVSLIRSGESAA